MFLGALMGLPQPGTWLRTVVVVGSQPAHTNSRRRRQTLHVENMMEGARRARPRPSPLSEGGARSVVGVAPAVVLLRMHAMPLEDAGEVGVERRDGIERRERTAPWFCSSRSRGMVPDVVLLLA